jgi:hypothetical protein
LHRLACRIGEAGEIALGIQGECGALAKGRDDGGGIANRIAFDGGDETVNIDELTQPAGDVDGYFLL